MGRSAEERAVIESWLRRIERDGIYAAQEAFRNATPGLNGKALPGPLSLEQILALAERGRLRVQHFFAWLDTRYRKVWSADKLIIGQEPAVSRTTSIIC